MPRGDDRKRGTILVVDDNTSSREVALRFIQRFGYQTLAISGGREALTALALRRVDAMVIDARMPDLDGFETARAIRDPSSTVLQHDLPIVLMTAGVTGDTRRRGREVGINDVITKPIDSAELRSALLRQLPTTSIDRPSAIPFHVADGSSAAELDTCDLLARLRGDEVGCAKIVELFLEDCEDELRGLTAAVAEGDLQSVCHRAHTIKGSAANVGAKRVEKLAADLEVVARDGGDVSPLVDAVDRAVLSVRTIWKQGAC